MHSKLMLFILALVLWLQLPGTSTSNGNGVPTGSCVSGSTYTDSSTGSPWTCKGNTWQLGATYAPMRFTTGTITGTLLIVGGCDIATVSVTGATTGMQVSVSPVSDPGIGIVWHGFVSSSGTVTVKECALVAGTPANTAYNGVVNQ